MPVISAHDVLKQIEDDSKKSAGRTAQSKSSQMPVRCRECGASFRLGSARCAEQGADSLQLRVQCVRCGRWISVSAERLAAWALDEFVQRNKAQDQGRNAILAVVFMAALGTLAWVLGTAGLLLFLGGLFTLSYAVLIATVCVVLTATVLVVGTRRVWRHVTLWPSKAKSVLSRLREEKGMLVVRDATPEADRRNGKQREP